eukprot:290924_1
MALHTIITIKAVTKNNGTSWLTDQLSLPIQVAYENKNLNVELKTTGKEDSLEISRFTTSTTVITDIAGEQGDITTSLKTHITLNENSNDNKQEYNTNKNQKKRMNKTDNDMDDVDEIGNDNNNSNSKLFLGNHLNDIELVEITVNTDDMNIDDNNNEEQDTIAP